MNLQEQYSLETGKVAVDIGIPAVVNYSTQYVTWLELKLKSLCKTLDLIEEDIDNLGFKGYIGNGEQKK